MCGIVGFTGVRQGQLLLSSSLALLEHRGRDDTARWNSSDGVFVGMNRLAINDLRRGLYPMKYRSYLLFFNGEIYNVDELRKILASRRVKLKTNCDAEVVLPLYDLYGVSGFNRMEGMFALAIVNPEKQEITLARDRFGEKPLYYLVCSGKLSFSSEMKVLLKSGLSPFHLREQSLAEYLRQGFVFWPYTLVEGIRKVPPGHVLTYSWKERRMRSLKTYWNVRSVDSKLPRLTDESLVDHLDALLRRAVQMRLLADVPVGCFLSGGIDSGLIASYAREKISNLRTFSVSFPESRGDDESDYSRIVSRLLETDHSEVECTAKDCLSTAERIGSIIDDPICDTAVLPTYLLAQHASRSVKVSLSGEGADELFAGYERYIKELTVLDLKRELPEWMIKTLFPAFRILRMTQGLSTPLYRHYSTQGIWQENGLISLLNIKLHSRSDHFLSLKPPTDTLRAMQLFDIRGYLPDQLLMKVDKMTMQHTLESRATYLDSSIARFALSLPKEWKIQRLTGKYILKRVGEKYLTKKIVWRRKHGFTVPIGLWLRNEFCSFAKDSVDAIMKTSSLFDREYYKRIVGDHLQGKHDYGDEIWSMIVLTRWASEHQIQI